MPHARTFETCASADSATPASEDLKQVTRETDRAQQVRATRSATDVATRLLPWRSADPSDRMFPIRTRLPAGLTEDELFAAYGAEAVLS
jgi:hypothetical protein